MDSMYLAAVKIATWMGPKHRFFNGYPEDLIAAGLIKAGQLPGDPGQKKTASRFVNDAGRKCRANTSGKMLRIYVYLTLAEQYDREMLAPIEY